MADLVVLTCASGKQCTQLIPLIYEQTSQFRLRLVVNSPRSLERLQKQWPKAEVLRANFATPDFCASVIKDATTLYYVGPPFNPQEAEYGMNMINAAITESKKPGSRFSHFVFSSVLHPSISKLLNHNRKRLIEERLIESMLPYTILQPSHFTDNAIDRLLSQKDEAHPVFTAAHDPNVAFSFTCVRDYAEVSAKVICEREKHLYATYQIASTLPMKYTEYINSIGSVMGKKFEVRQMPYEQALEIYCKLVFGEEAEVIDQAKKDGPERLLMYYNGRGLMGNPGVLEWLLQRPGTTPSELARMKLENMSLPSSSST